MRIFIKIILPIFAIIIIIYTVGYYFLIYQMIRETSMRSIGNEYIVRVKSELTSMQGEMNARPKVSFGSPSSSAWNPRSSIKAVTCAAADKIIPEARRSGYNFLVAGNASDPSSQVSVNERSLFVIIIDLNTLPKGFVAKDKRIEMEIPYETSFSGRSVTVSTSWLTCEKSIVVLPSVVN